jgi:hypothetical protein
MKIEQAAIGCALSILMSMPAIAPAAANPRMGQDHSLITMQSKPKNMQSFWIVRTIQNKLKGEGYDVGNADGIWGIKTTEALKKYQMDHGIKASGKVNQKTAYLLGLNNNELSTFEEEIDNLSSYRNNG